MAALAAPPQVYCKVSGMVELAADQPAPTQPAYYRPTLDALWTTFGEDRLVFGTNWPVSDRAAPFSVMVAIVRSYFEDRGTTAARKYWYENARRAYRFEERG
jgi:L-fuconolactonase